MILIGEVRILILTLNIPELLLVLLLEIKLHVGLCKICLEAGIVAAYFDVFSRRTLL